MQASGSKGTLVTGVIGDDVHVIGIRILEHALRTAGFNIVPLGVQVPQEEFVNAAIETGAQGILVSSLSGHAEVVASGLRDKCIEVGLKDIILYLGGQLVIGEARWEDVVKKFSDLGFDRVYPSDTRPAQVVAALEADLAAG